MQSPPAGLGELNGTSLPYSVHISWVIYILYTTFLDTGSEVEAVDSSTLFHKSSPNLKQTALGKS